MPYFLRLPVTTCTWGVVLVVMPFPKCGITENRRSKNYTFLNVADPESISSTVCHFLRVNKVFSWQVLHRQLGRAFKN